MARYVDIECDAVTEVIGRKAFRNRSDIQDFLDNIPTADVVPVVRCKDCKRCEHFYPECDVNGNHREAYYCKSIKGDVKPDDYCCWGERRCEMIL